MKPQATSITSAQPNGLRSAKAVCRDRGISDVTLWRWQRRGWVKTVNISGKIYVDLKSLAEFDRRAAAGEFAQLPSGVARQQPSQGQKGGAASTQEGQM